MADLLQLFSPIYYAGFSVPTVAKFEPKNDGTTSLLQAVTLAATDGAPIGTAENPLITTDSAAVIPSSPTAVETAVASSATSVTILAANSSRHGYSIFNDSDQILYLRQSATAATKVAGGYTVQIAAGAYWECPFNYTGAVRGIWASANGSASITEYS